MRQSLTLIEPTHGIATATSEARTLCTGACEARHDAFLNARTLELRDRAKDAGHESPAGVLVSIPSAQRDECHAARLPIVQKHHRWRNPPESIETPLTFDEIRHAPEQIDETALWQLNSRFARGNPTLVHTILRAPLTLTVSGASFQRHAETTRPQYFERSSGP